VISHASLLNGPILVRSSHDVPLQVGCPFCNQAKYEEPIGSKGKEYRKDNEGITGEVMGSRGSSQKVVQGRARRGKGYSGEEKGKDKGRVVYPMLEEVFRHSPKENEGENGEAEQDNELSLPYPFDIVNIEDKEKDGQTEKAK
jgi:hypothetical protein